MPTITINGQLCDFEPGQMILQVANAHGIGIPQYCYHDGLTIVANCRICLGQIWAPNPRNEGKVEPFMGGKLMPTCQTPAADGMVVRTDSPTAIANQKSVMEYLLINHPLDCPVCDQAGECLLQDYSFQYGRGTSRFEEQKVKNPKKDLGPHVFLYADRCIMCTLCVRFAREVAGTGELLVVGRGNQEEIDVFPGVPLDNELSANVIDLCPVGALLDKDFLFAQRVWFLKSTPSIDPITASGDNIWIEHNQGIIYRIKPRDNAAINKWWITDEVRYGWKFVHADERLTSPRRREFGALIECSHDAAQIAAIEAVKGRLGSGGHLALVVSPMLSCEDAFALVSMVHAIDPGAILAVGPVPTDGQDKILPKGIEADDPRAFRISAEKAPNAAGVRRVLAGIAGTDPLEFDGLLETLRAGTVAGLILTGNYPSSWATPALTEALSLDQSDRPVLVLIDTLDSPLVELADVVFPAATWAEKAGCFENHAGVIQAFEQAIPPVGLARTEAQIALDLLTRLGAVEADAPDFDGYEIVDEGPGEVPAAVEVHRTATRLYSAPAIRQQMAEQFPSLGVFVTDLHSPAVEARQNADLQMVEL